jgi:hypothetical protein
MNSVKYAIELAGWLVFVLSIGAGLLAFVRMIGLPDILAFAFAGLLLSVVLVAMGSRDEDDEANAEAENEDDADTVDTDWAREDTDG